MYMMVEKLGYKVEKRVKYMQDYSDLIRVFFYWKPFLDINQCENNFKYDYGYGYSFH